MGWAEGMSEIKSNHDDICTAHSDYVLVFMREIEKGDRGVGERGSATKRLVCDAMMHKVLNVFPRIFCRLSSDDKVLPDYRIHVRQIA